MNLSTAEIALLEAFAKKHASSKVMLGSWAFLKDDERAMVEMADWIESQDWTAIDADLIEGKIVFKTSKLILRNQ